MKKKYAERIDGIDLRGREPGDVFDLPADEAALLMAEEWAILERRLRQTEHSLKRRAEDFEGEVAS